MGYDILPADIAGYADNLRTNPVGFLDVAKMGKLVGKMDNPISDRTLLWSDALLRNITVFHN